MRAPFFCLLAPALVMACGGGSPPANDPTAAAEHGSSQPQKDWRPATAPGADTPPPPTPTPNEPAAGSASSPAASKPAAGDLVAPAADDPWMAPHQMPAGDVLKTMRAATARVNGCWRAAKKRDSSVSGEVKIKFVITHEGAVRVWRNEDSSVSDEQAINCVGEVVKSQRFPTQKAPGDAWGIFSIQFGE